MEHGRRGAADRADDHLRGQENERRPERHHQGRRARCHRESSRGRRRTLRSCRASRTAAAQVRSRTPRAAGRPGSRARAAERSRRPVRPNACHRHRGSIPRSRIARAADSDCVAVDLSVPRPAAVSRAATIPARLLLCGIVAASFLERYEPRSATRRPLYFPDEYIYSGIARSLAQSGRPLILGSSAHFPALLERCSRRRSG